jgi:hypothetical protein
MNIHLTNRKIHNVTEKNNIETYACMCRIAFQKRNIVKICIFLLCENRTNAMFEI